MIYVKWYRGSRKKWRKAKSIKCCGIHAERYLKYKERHGSID